MGHQKHEDNVASVKKEVELYLANLNEQLLQLLQTICGDPKNERFSVNLKNQNEKNSRALLHIVTKIGTHKLEFILPQSLEKTRDEISSKISSLCNTDDQAEYGKKFMLKGLVMNNYNGYSPLDFKTTQLSKLDLDLAQSGIALLTRSPEWGAKAQKLLIRLSTISKLKDTLDNTVDPAKLKSEVSATVAICKANKPSWSEQPFLDKLKDIVSLGVRYMFFHQDETKVFEEKTKPSLSSPAPKK